MDIMDNHLEATLVYPPLPLEFRSPIPPPPLFPQVLESIQKEIEVMDIELPMFKEPILNSEITSRKIVFYDNFGRVSPNIHVNLDTSFQTFTSTWMHHSKNSCHIGPFSCHIGHFLSFWIVSQKTMFSISGCKAPRRVQLYMI